MTKINLYYHKSVNFGDMLSPYIVSKMAKVPLTDINSVKFNDSNHKYIFTGSLLGTDRIHNATIFGAGFAHSDSLYFSDTVHIKLIRGELSYNKAVEQKNKNSNQAVFIDSTNCVGEPSLLLPYYFSPTSKKKYKLGVIPHIIDYDNTLSKFKKDTSVKIIDLYWRHEKENLNEFLERVITEISECEMTISSSLHGVIVSLAYSVPTDWCEFSKGKIIGDGFKYYDFIRSVSSAQKDLISPISLLKQEELSLEHILPLHRRILNDKIDPKKILEKNPF